MEVNHRHDHTTNSIGPLQHASVDVLMIVITVSLVLSPLIFRTTQPAPGPALPTPLVKLNLNDAPVSELGLLPAIGPRMADRLIQYRDAQQHFGSWADVEKVSGMGPATIQTIQPWCVISPAPEFIVQISQ
jgi:competence ComEA-like helix-hairpin-helix protein